MIEAEKINLNSPFLRECVCKFSNKKENELQKEDISSIKYLHIMGETGCMALSNKNVPNYIYFDEMGDETTNIYDLWNPNLDLKKVIKKEIGKKGWIRFKKVPGIQNRLENPEREMKEFQKEIVEYMLSEDYQDKLEKIPTLDEFCKELGAFLKIDFNDLKFFNGLEALRITDLEGMIIDSLEFLFYMPKLKILEIGGDYILLHENGIEMLKNLNQFCIWEE